MTKTASVILGVCLGGVFSVALWAYFSLKQDREEQSTVDLNLPAVEVETGDIINQTAQEDRTSATELGYSWPGATEIDPHAIADAGFGEDAMEVGLAHEIAHQYLLGPEEEVRARIPKILETLRTKYGVEPTEADFRRFGKMELIADLMAMSTLDPRLVEKYGRIKAIPEGLYQPIVLAKNSAK